MKATGCGQCGGQCGSTEAVMGEGLAQTEERKLSQHV